MANRSLIYENPTDYTQTPYTTEQLTTAAQAAGIAPATLQQEFQQNVQAAQGPTNPGTAAAPPPPPAAPAAVPNPSWIYAVNMPSTYPDFAAMRQAGAGLVVTSDDPNLALLIDGARQWGIPFAIQVNAAAGVTPEQYAAQVAQAQTLGPSKLVLDIETPGKGYEGSAGWDWSQQTAALLKPIVQGQSVAVTMEPHQEDYNYGAFQNLSGNTTDFWVQTYTGDMTSVDAAWATGAATASGAGNVMAILAPGVAPPTGSTSGYVSYGIPTTGASAAGIYAPGATSNTPYYPGQTPVAGAGSGNTPGPPIFVNPSGPYGGGANTPPPGAAPGVTATSSQSQDWATAYFGSLGLPADVQNQVASIFAKYPDQPQLAIELARQSIRTTQWFQQTFPGFFNGLRNGLYQDESGYRAYVSQANYYTQQYFNRPITSGEIESALTQGLTPEILGRTYDAHAISAATGGDTLYALGAFGDNNLNPPGVDVNNPDQRGQIVSAISRQQAGLTSDMGSRLQAALDRANKRMQTVFGGQLAIPNTAGQALNPSTRPDIGA